MKAGIGRLPDDDGRWAFEIKWDGYRTIAHLGGGRARLQSTAGHDVSERWPELIDLGSAINATSAIVDGELVVLDDDGWPRFELVQQSGPGGDRQAVLHLFDVLSIAGTDTIGVPYEERRRLLADLVEPGDNWAIPPNRIGDGAALLAATADIGLEGVIAKRLGSLYRPGTRSKDWRKVKNRRPVEVVIGGYTTGSGSRATTFGSLLVGRRDGGRLVFAGGVGTGFDHATLDALAARLRDMTAADCPFDPPPASAYGRHATWVEPVLRARIEIAEFTNEGLVRHASFVELVDE